MPSRRGTMCVQHVLLRLDTTTGPLGHFTGLEGVGVGCRVVHWSGRHTDQPKAACAEFACICCQRAGQYGDQTSARSSLPGNPWLAAPRCCGMGGDVQWWRVFLQLCHGHSWPVDFASVTLQS